ncbi:MAG: hypothetical protein ISS18_16070 [Bacteroidales bacterium]|nr:hypothetical protein [Bacteroidales bacterium]
MSKFITVGNVSLIKANIIKYKTKEYKGAEYPFWIIVNTSDSARQHDVKFKTEEERDKAFEKFTKELDSN